ncbi:hypothetical protein GCM10023092_02340 [Rurimicrobium arvi]|uniref:Ig-like domain-containing protein n=2 Tax=Rurimicrobium arvi TaxID=2049916 RepID=A0ABP8MDL8_9BACT
MLLVFLAAGFTPRQAQAIIKTFGSPPGSSTMSDMYTYSSAYSGIYSYYKYGANAAIYGASEIGIAGTINSYAIYKYSGSTSPSLTLDSTYIFMKEVGTTKAVSSPLSLDGFQEVFRGTFANSTASGWQTVTLTTPFVYSGTGNLCIIVTHRRSSSSGQFEYYYLSYAYGSGYNVGYQYNASTTWTNWINTGSSTPSTLSLTSSTTSYRPYMQFNIDPPACTGTPTAGTAVASSTTACAGVPVSLSLSGGTTVASSLTYHWDTSSTGAAGTWNALGTATTYPGTYSYIPPTGRTLYYRCWVTCSAGGSADTSTKVAVAVGTALLPPYSETFESLTPGNNATCAGAFPLFSTGVTSAYGTDYWKMISATYDPYAGSNHTPGGANYLVAGYYVYYTGSYSSQSGFWFTPGIRLEAGKTYRYSYWYRVAGYVSSYYSTTGIRFGMYYGTTQTPSGMTALKTDWVDANNTYKQAVVDFTPTTTATYYMAAKSDNMSYAYYGGGIFDDFNLIELPACSTAVTAADLKVGSKAAVSPNAICSVPGSTTLSLSSTPAYSGLSYSWEVASGTPTSFSSAGISTLSGSYSITAANTYYFRCKITCTASGLSAYSDTVKVITTPITPPYLEDFESGTAGTNMPCAGSTYWNTRPYYWNLANSPYDATYAPGIKNHTAGGTNYLHAGYYLGYGTGNAEYWFTPGLALTAGKAYNVSYWYSNSAYYPIYYSSYPTDMGIYAGTAQNAAAMTITTGDDTTIYIDALSTATYDKFQRGFIAPATGTYYVGIKVNHKNYCYYGFAIDDIGVDQLPPCSAKPTAGKAVATPSVICGSGSTTVSLSGTSLASDLSFQWQDSSSTGWNDISGATLPSYVTPTLTTSRKYRCRVTCGLIPTPNSDVSASVEVKITPLNPPYYEDFEAAKAGINIPCASYTGSWSSTSYWWLYDAAMTGSYAGIANHTTGGKKFLYAGYYLGGYYSSTTGNYWFTPSMNLTAGKSYNFSMWFSGSGYSSDYNNQPWVQLGLYAGTAQTAAGMTYRLGGLDTNILASDGTYRKLSRSFTAPITAAYYIGIKVNMQGYCYPGIALDDMSLVENAACTGRPTAGKADATNTMICSSGTSVLRLSGTSASSGLTYQWQVSTTSATSGFGGATGTSATYADYTTPTLSTPGRYYYRCIVTCSATGLSDTSTAAVVNVGYVIPPYKEDFERTTASYNTPCASYYSPYGWSNTASSYYYLGIRAGDTYPYYAGNTNHTPGGVMHLSAGYAVGSYYSSSYATNYWFTPGILLTKDSTYEFSYWYSLSSYGATCILGMYYGTAQTSAGMTTAIIPDFTASSSSFKQLIGRFVAPSTGTFYLGIKMNNNTYNYYGTSIDDINLEQLPPCTAKPVAGTVAATPTMLCSAGAVSLSMDMSTASRAAGLRYQWYSSTTSPTSGFTTLSGLLTSPGYSTSASATTWYKCVVTCSYTGDTVASSTIKVDVGVVIPPYIETFETVAPGTNAPCAGYTYGWGSYSYWYTYGAPLSPMYAPSMDNHTPGGSRYLSTGYYPLYYSGAYEYWFTPAIKLTAGSLYQFSFWYVRSGYDPSVAATLGVYYGTAQTKAAMTTALGPDLTGIKTTMYKQYKAQFTPTASGNFYFGIKTGLAGYDYYGGTAIDDIGLQEVPPCSSSVVAGTINSDPAHVCSAGGSASLNLDGTTLATGLSYEWLSAPSATGPWTTTGGTSLPYVTDPLFTDTWFRAVVKCTATGITDTTSPVLVEVGAFSVPYTEDFESTPFDTKPLCSEATDWGMSYGSTYGYIWSVRKGAISPITNHTPGGKSYLIGGYMLGYYATASYGYPTVTDDNYWFTPGLALDSRYKYELSFWYISTSSYTQNRMAVKYGKTQTVGGMTNTLLALRQVSNGTYAQFDTTFKPSTSGTYYIGFQKTVSPSGAYAYPGVGFDDINLNYAPCDGTPMAGNIRSSMASGTGKCKGTYLQLTDTGATISLVPGIKYLWMRRDLSTPLAPWTVIAGAVDTTIAADTLVGYEYKFAVICNNTHDTAYSSAFQIPQLTPHPSVTVAPSTTPITYCLGDTVKFNATNYTGAVYDWMLDSVVIPGWKFSDLGATEPGTYMVKVTSALSPCPAYSNQVKMIVNDPGYSVTITKPADSILCAGSSVLLTAVASKPGVTFQWRKDNVAIPGATSATYLVTTGGYYRVMASDGTSTCAAASRNVEMVVKPNPPAVITVPGGTTTACENEGILLQASTGGFSYEWMRGGTTVYGLIDSAVLIKNSGVYSVKVRNADGCATTSSSITVNILPSPVPVIVRTGDRLTTTISYPTYQWIRNGLDIPAAAGGTASFYDITLKGLYKVRVTATNNCEGESTPLEAMDDWLSIDQSSLGNAEIKVFPNPTSGKVTIASPMPVQVQVKDLSGRVIIQSQQTKEVDLSKLADGVYMFVILDKEGIQQIAQQRVTKVTNK